MIILQRGRGQDRTSFVDGKQPGRKLRNRTHEENSLAYHHSGCINSLRDGGLVSALHFRSSEQQGEEG